MESLTIRKKYDYQITMTRIILMNMQIKQIYALDTDIFPTNL